MDNKSLIWPNNTKLNSIAVIGVIKGGLYKVPGNFIKYLIHEIVSPCEMWHRRLHPLHFKSLPGLQKMVKCMLEFQYEHDSVCRGCALGKKIKKQFPSSANRSKGIIY